LRDRLTKRGQAKRRAERDPAQYRDQQPTPLFFTSQTAPPWVLRFVG
jgi:hypothetical protein